MCLSVETTINKDRKKAFSQKKLLGGWLQMLSQIEINMVREDCILKKGQEENTEHLMKKQPAIIL